VGMATDTRQQINSGLTAESVVITGPSRVVKNIENGSSLRHKKDKES